MPPTPLLAVIDLWFDACEAVLSVQRSLVASVLTPRTGRPAAPSGDERTDAAP